jgi:hypothetical protein
MIIYKGDYYNVYEKDKEYNQKKFSARFDENFKYFSKNLHMHEDRDGRYESCYLFATHVEAKEFSKGNMAIRIGEYDLTEQECQTLLIKKFLKINPNKIWYYSLNESSGEMEEFKLKAFM